jgi:hypothetical protein
MPRMRSSESTSRDPWVSERQWGWGMPEDVLNGQALDLLRTLLRGVGTYA